MSKDKKIEMLNEYIKMNIAPILLEDVPSSVFAGDAVIIPSNIDVSLLNGHYDGIDFIPPEWYIKLNQKQNFNNNILVIDDISSIPKNEQTKFYEILKYRKIGTFDLPKNCVIIITCKHEYISLIDNQILSLVACI